MPDALQDRPTTSGCWSVVVATWVWCVVGVGPPAGSTPFCLVGGSRRAGVWLVLGGVLLSRTLAGAVPSALGVLAS